MLHLITAWPTRERKGEPTVLYCGPDRRQAQRIATEADPKLLRVEFAEVLLSFPWTRRVPPAKRSEAVIPTTVPAPQNSRIIEKSTPAPPPAEGSAAQPAEEVASAGDGLVPTQSSEAGPELSPAPVAENQKPETRNQKPSRR